MKRFQAAASRTSATLHADPMSAPTFFLLACALLLLAYCAAAWHRRRTRFRRAVVYLVDGPHLLVMQKDRGGAPRPKLELPKGKIKRRETPLQAAYRECLEETGLHVTDLQFLTSLHADPRSPKRRTPETWAAFWGTVPAGTRVPFTHQVTGRGGDQGRRFHYRLLPIDELTLHPPLDRGLPALRRALKMHAR